MEFYVTRFAVYKDPNIIWVGQYCNSIPLAGGAELLKYHTFHQVFVPLPGIKVLSFAYILAILHLYIMHR